jgi:hypothetical protein
LTCSTPALTGAKSPMHSSAVWDEFLIPSESSE